MRFKVYKWASASTHLQKCKASPVSAKWQLQTSGLGMSLMTSYGGHHWWPATATGYWLLATDGKKRMNDSEIPLPSHLYFTFECLLVRKSKLFFSCLLYADLKLESKYRMDFQEQRLRRIFWGSFGSHWCQHYFVLKSERTYFGGSNIINYCMANNFK